MDKRRLVAGALGASLLISALPGLALAQDEEPYSAERVDWALTSYAVDGVMTDVPEGVEASLFMSGGDANGNGGCNSFFGSYEIGPDTLTFGPLGSTRALCQEPSQGVEDAYLALLPEVAGWAVEDKTLSLSDASGAVTLVYSDTPVVVTSGDVASLNEELAALQAQIDEAEAEIAALVEAAADIPINKFDNRLTRTQEKVAALEKKTEGPNTKNLDRRITANEEAIANISNSLTKLRKRISTLEATAEDHEERIAALEVQPEQPLP